MTAPTPDWTRTLALPPGYRLRDVLDFHRRDAERLAEEVTEELAEDAAGGGSEGAPGVGFGGGPGGGRRKAATPRLRKGVLLDGVPVLLEIVFDHAGAPASASRAAYADGALGPDAPARAHEATLGMLGLRIDPEPFRAFAAGDPLLGRLTRAQPGLRIVQSATVFEALTWAIIGQQINLPFAIALRRTFIEQAGRRHSGGLWCYPAAADVAALDAEALTSRKFSRAKADTLLRLARLVAGGELKLEVSGANSIEDIAAALLAVKGIGPWTVNYALLRGYGHADCSLHGDVAIRAALQKLLGEDVKPDLARTERILARYRPHRTMAAAHLWASLHPREPGENPT